MSKLEVPGYDFIEFDAALVPDDYWWSGHCDTIEKFKQENFLTFNHNGHSYLVCHWNNALALGDYLSEYIENQYIPDMCWYLCPDMIYWFYLYNETRYRSFDDLGWPVEILQIIFPNRLFALSDENCKKWTVILDSEQVENGLLSQGKLEEIERYCREYILEIFEDRYNDGCERDEIFNSEFSSSGWLSSIFQEFCLNHSFVEE